MKETVDATRLSQWLSEAVALTNTVFVAVDLAAHDERLAALPQAQHPRDRCVFLGCTLGPRLTERLRSHHGLIFPTFERLPFKVYRNHLYTPEELFRGYHPDRPESVYRTPDWRTYTSYIQVGDDHKPLKPPRYVEADADIILARRLHDHFVQDQSARLLKSYAEQNRGVIAIMGGHDTLRGPGLYAEIACLCRQLAQAGLIIATGGGPGLMEAANLGAYFADKTEPDLRAAIDRLAAAPRYDHADWLKTAWLVRRDYPITNGDITQSLGLPTWFYGHEPPNVFASHIAKYFENSVREEGLLAIATHGVVFAPGNAGTVQEIFQDACQNYYVTYAFRSPMILFDETYWNPPADETGAYPTATPERRCKPAWPLLQQMAREQGFEDLVSITSDVNIVKETLLRFQVPENVRVTKAEKASPSNT